MDSGSNLHLETSVPDSTNQCKTQKDEHDGPTSLVTRALISTSQNVSNSEHLARGPRLSDPLRPLSNTSKSGPRLSTLLEDSIDETNDTILPLSSKLNLIQMKNNSTSDKKPEIKSDKKSEINREEMLNETRNTIPHIKSSPRIELEEDIKSVRSGVSDVFYDAEEEFVNIETVDDDVQDFQNFRRRCGRDESNFGHSFYGKTGNVKNDQTVQNNDVSKKKANRRTVSFSKASRRWSQLRSANRISTNFSRLSKRQSVSNNVEEVEDEVQLRRKR